MKTLSASRRRGSRLRILLLALTVLIALLPLAWTLLASFGITPNNSAPPAWNWNPTVQNYVEIGVTTPTFAQALATSLGVSLAATMLTTFVSFLAAYGLAHMHLRRGWILVQSLLILASVPVMAYGLPLLTILQAEHLYDTFAGIILASGAVFAPLAVYILYGYVRQVPADWEHAARIEGASLGQMLWHVVLPGILPGMAATAVIVFVLNWNILLVPMLLSANNVKTIPVIMSDFFQLEREIDWGSAAAVLITSLVPLLVLIVTAHRVLERLNIIVTQPGE